jgi:hypothetical protein
MLVKAARQEERDDLSAGNCAQQGNSATGAKHDQQPSPRQDQFPTEAATRNPVITIRII